MYLADKNNQFVRIPKALHGRVLKYLLEYNDHLTKQVAGEIKPVGPVQMKIGTETRSFPIPEPKGPATVALRTEAYNGMMLLMEKLSGEKVGKQLFEEINRHENFPIEIGLEFTMKMPA
jgi:hypothetical protein